MLTLVEKNLVWHSYEHSVGVVELSNHQASFPPFNFLLTRSLLPPAACSACSAAPNADLLHAGRRAPAALLRV